MLAIVTSTIKPSTTNSGVINSFYSWQERLDQTKNTLTGLQKQGFEKIYLVDNSPALDKLQLRQLFIDFPYIEIHHIPQYQFTNNKGINELLMLLYICQYLPAGKILFKISGRYCPNEQFIKPYFEDIAAKGYHFEDRTGTISTRAYWAKDVAIYEIFLLQCLNEVFTYPQRIVGIRSLYRKLANIFSKKTIPSVNISIEFAAANVLKRNKYNVTLLNILGIKGYIAGVNKEEEIAE